MEVNGNLFDHFENKTEIKQPHQGLASISELKTLPDLSRALDSVGPGNQRGFGSEGNFLLPGNQNTQQRLTGSLNEAIKAGQLDEYKHNLDYLRDNIKNGTNTEKIEKYLGALSDVRKQALTALKENKIGSIDAQRIFETFGAEPRESADAISRIADGKDLTENEVENIWEQNGAKMIKAGENRQDVNDIEEVENNVASFPI